MERWSEGGCKRRLRRLIKAVVHVLVVPVNGVEGLRHCERQQENSGNQGENCPGVPKVRMDQLLFTCPCTLSKLFLGSRVTSLHKWLQSLSTASPPHSKFLGLLDNTFYDHRCRINSITFFHTLGIPEIIIDDTHLTNSLKL